MKILILSVSILLIALKGIFLYNDSLRNLNKNWKQQTGENIYTYESLTQSLAQTSDDTNKVLVLLKISTLSNTHFKESLNYVLQGLSLSKKLRYYKGLVLCGIKAGALLEQDNKKAESIALLLETNELCEQAHDRYNQAQVFRYLGYIYNDSIGLSYHLRSLKLSQELKISEIDNPINGTLAIWYIDNNILDSALFYNQKCYQELLSTNHLDYQSLCLKLFGQIYSKMGQYGIALDYFRQSLAIRQQYNFWDFGELNAEMAHIYKIQGQHDSAIYHAEQALAEAQKINTKVAIKNRLNAATILFELNRNKNSNIALKYHLLAITAKDLLNNIEHIKQVERITYNEQKRFQFLQQEKEKAVMWSSLAFITLIACSLLYINRQKQKTNILLLEQKLEINQQAQLLEAQKEILEHSLLELQITQAQLIQIETQQNLEKERTRIARDMHDDISSGLSAINLLANYIKNTPLSTDTHLEIKHIAESSTELNQRIREIIWSVSSDSDNMEGLAHFLRRYVSEFGEMHHLDTRFTASDDLPDMKLPNEIKRNLFLCVKEALNNAAKYAKATLVEVEFMVENGLITLSIKDNGIGFDVETALKNGGNGLKNIRERMVQIGGEVVFLKENGCEIVLIMKI